MSARWAGAQVEFSGYDKVSLDGFSFDDWRNGWTAGVGFEYKFAHNMSFGVEYSFIEFGSETNNGRTRRLALPVTLTDHDLQIQWVTARLNFQFYRDEYRAPPLLK
jgi:opacity protein-like surface antigen